MDRRTMEDLIFMLMTSTQTYIQLKVPAAFWSLEGKKSVAAKQCE